MVAWSIEDLTVLSEKCYWYPVDSYFREASQDFEAACVALADLNRHALVVIKPDAIAARLVPDVLKLVDEAGFDIVMSEPVAYDRHSYRAAWRYQTSRASSDLLLLLEAVLSKSPSLALLVRSRTEDPLPATVRASGMKGAAIPERRAPASWRTILGSPNRVLTFLHVADEPADLIREFGLLFDWRRRRELLHSFGAEPVSAASMEELEPRAGAYDVRCMRANDPDPLLQAAAERANWGTQFDLRSFWSEVEA
ncbi:MAG: hypothetical protein H0V73_02150, partial [Chloroflexi bacterium]|nr:hypothetical protein [Chloroflexota bacterium]